VQIKSRRSNRLRPLGCLLHDLLEAAAIAVGILVSPPASGTITRAMVSLSQP